MRLNRNELRKILYDFNSFSNRLLQADYNDYAGVLGKFLNYIDGTPIIIDYIKDCGECEWNLADEVNKVQSSYGRLIFPTGDSNEEEVRNVYAVLRYLVETDNSVHYGVAMGYSHSNGYQDKIKGFNDRFVMVLIRHVEGYLTKVGIDMGLDDKVVYNVTVHNGQAIIASENANVTATNNVGINTDELAKLIADVRATSGNLTPEDQVTVADSLEVIETEASANKPKKGMLKTAIATLKTVKGIAEFGSAVVALAEFVGPLI
jgi:hypothetical protein